MPALIGCASGGVAIAVEQSQDFLDAIYAAHEGKDAKGINIAVAEQGAGDRHGQVQELRLGRRRDARPRQAQG
jgi:hypothetical protein